MKEYKISEANASEIVPFADAEVVKTLTEGISPGFEENVFAGVLTLILEMPKHILDPVTQLTDVERQRYIVDARRALPRHFMGFADGMKK